MKRRVCHHVSIFKKKKFAALQKSRESAWVESGVSLPAVTLAEWKLQTLCVADVPNQVENSTGKEVKHEDSLWLGTHRASH